MGRPKLSKEEKLARKFEKLDKELRSTFDNLNDDEVKAKVSEVALYRQARKELMEQDPDIQQVSEQLALLKADYTSEIKGAELQITYLKNLLENRGKL